MPRPARHFANTACLGAALLVGLSQSIALRADSPANPLRPALSPPDSIRLVPTAADSQIGPAAWQLSDAADPQSVVPPHFGQPELLPAPVGTSPLAPEFLATPDFSADHGSHNLVHPWLDEPWFAHGDPNDPRRHIGIGQPLVGTSWRNRPLYFGTFIGGVMMGDLATDRIYQNDTSFVGARLGFDFDHFWGLEGRWAFARPDLADGSGTPLFPASRDNFADVSLVYYPLGDARWRPYLVAGIGFTTYRFNDELGQRISEAALDIPLGFGVKYFYGPWFTLRFDFVDNLSIGNARLSGMHNVALMAGAEFRFGGRRPSYFPWHNNTAYW